MTAAIVQVAELIQMLGQRQEDNFVLLMSKLNLMDLELQKITKKLEHLDGSH